MTNSVTAGHSILKPRDMWWKEGKQHKQQDEHNKNNDDKVCVDPLAMSVSMQP